MPDRIKLPRPTAAELSVALGPSSETEQVEIAKPVHDYLLAKLHDRATVDTYVSSRITSELVRLSKMKSGETGWHTSSATRSANAKAQWRKYHAAVESGEIKPHNSIRVRVFEEPHRAYIGLADRKRERTRIAGEIIMDWCEAIDRDALLEYCAANPHKPQKFVTLPPDAVSAARVIAERFSVPFTKIICYILANEA